MSATSKFAIYQSTTGELSRAGRCPFGMEAGQIVSPTDVLLDDEAINSLSLVGFSGTLEGARHFVDIDDSNIVKNRVPIDPWFDRVTCYADGIDEIFCTNLPKSTSNPTFAETTVRVVGPGVDTTATTSTGGASFTFDAEGEYTITFSAYPKYLESVVVVTAIDFVSGEIVPPSIITRGAIGTVSVQLSPTAELPQVTSSVVLESPGLLIEKTADSVSSTTSIEAPSVHIMAEVTGVSAAATVGAVIPEIRPGQTSIVATGEVATGIPAWIGTPGEGGA